MWLKWLERLFPRLGGGDKLESLRLKSLHLGDDWNLRGHEWPEVLSRVHEAFPSLRTFRLDTTGDRFGNVPLYFCPLFQRLAGRRLGPASRDRPGENPQNRGDGGGLCCSSFSDEHGGTFRFTRTVDVWWDAPVHLDKLHELSVRYERGDTGTAEGMGRALDRIAQGVCWLEQELIDSGIRDVWKGAW